MEKEILKKAADLLIKNRRYTTTLNISQGLAGIALFLFHYAHAMNDEYYYDHAFDILEGIQTQLSDPSQKKQEERLPELGWILLHLIREDLIEFDADELLQHIDTRLYNNCVYNDFRTLRDGQPIWAALYFTERHQHTQHNYEKIKIEEAFIHIINNVRRLYTSDIKERIPIINGSSTVADISVFHHLITVVSCISVLLKRILHLSIGKQFILELMSVIQRDMNNLILNNTFIIKKVQSSTKMYALYATVIVACYGMDITEIYDPVSALSSLKTPDNNLFNSPSGNHDISSLLISLSCIHHLNTIADFTEKTALLQQQLQRSFLSDQPGYPGSRTGIPNLGLKDGIAGIGVAYLAPYLTSAQLKNDLLLLTSF